MNSYIDSTYIIIGIIVVALIILAPLFSIWSLNTLFGTGIEYTLETWFAAFWVNLLTYSKYNKIK